jgi:hypothetical protein
VIETIYQAAKSDIAYSISVVMPASPEDVQSIPLINGHLEWESDEENINAFEETSWTPVSEATDVCFGVGKSIEKVKEVQSDLCSSCTDLDTCCLLAHSETNLILSFLLHTVISNFNPESEEGLKFFESGSTSPYLSLWIGDAVAVFKQLRGWYCGFKLPSSNNPIVGVFPISSVVIRETILHRIG